LGPTFPPLPPATVAFAESGLSLLVGTCGVDLAPDCVRAAGVRIWPDACRLTVLVPHATSATSIANLRANPRLALTGSQIPSHTTIQIKGKVLAVRDGDAADHDLALRYRVTLAAAFAGIGQLPRNGLRFNVWPAWAVDLEIETVFEQTPGPKAGARMGQT
jgi:hypothetical protein